MILTHRHLFVVANLHLYTRNTTNSAENRPRTLKIGGKGSSRSYFRGFSPMKTSIFCSEIFSGVRSLTDRTPEIVGRPSDKIRARKNHAKTKHREIPIQMEKLKPSGDFSECKMGPMELLSGPTVYRIQRAIR